MARFSGRRVNVGIGLESARGTAVAPTYFYPEMEVSIVDKDTPLYGDSSYGNILKNSSKNTMLVNGDGGLSGLLWAKGLYYWLALICGQLPTTTDVAGDTAAKKHAFTLLNTNEHISATIAVKEPNQDLRFALSMPDGIKIKWAVGELPKIELAFISKASATATNTAVYVDDSKFLPTQVSFKLADALSGLTAATALTDIKSFSLEVKKNLSAHQTSDSGNTYGAICNTDLEISGSIEKLYNDTTYRGYALQDTIKAMEFAFSDSTNKAGTTTPTSLSFRMSKVAFDSPKPSYSLGGIATETLNWTALMSIADAPFAAELINKYTYA